jgi:hypothetical protein
VTVGHGARDIVLAIARAFDQPRASRSQSLGNIAFHVLYEASNFVARAREQVPCNGRPLRIGGSQHQDLRSYVHESR